MSAPYIDKCLSEWRDDLLFQEELAIRDIIWRLESSWRNWEPRFEKEYISNQKILDKVTEARKKIIWILEA